MGGGGYHFFSHIFVGCFKEKEFFEITFFVQKKSLRFEAKKPYDFDKNVNTSVLSKKEQPNTTGKIPRKFKPIKYIWLLGQ